MHHLIDLFNSMVDAGNTVYVVEHNTDVIRAADFVVEMGPGAGELGGNVIFSGTPAELLKSDKSITAQYAR